MHAVGDFRAHVDQAAAMPHQIAQVEVDAGLRRTGVSATIQQRLGDPQQVEDVRTGLHVFALFLGVEGIHGGHEPTTGTQRMDEVHRVAGRVLTAEEDVAGVDGVLLAARMDAIKKELDAFGGVPYRERLAQVLAAAVAQQRRVGGFGVVEGHAHNLARMTGLLEEREQVLTLRLVDGSISHGEAPFALQLFFREQTALFTR